MFTSCLPFSGVPIVSFCFAGSLCSYVCLMCLRPLIKISNSLLFFYRKPWLQKEPLISWRWGCHRERKKGMWDYNKGLIYVSGLFLKFVCLVGNPWNKGPATLWGWASLSDIPLLHTEYLWGLCQWAENSNRHERRKRRTRPTWDFWSRGLWEGMQMLYTGQQSCHVNESLCAVL